MTTIEWRASLSIALIFFCRMMGLFMVLPVLALYADEIAGSSLTLIGIAIGIYGLTQALFQIPMGMLSDRIGRKPVILAGLVLFLLGGLIAAYADSIVGVIVGRCMQGAGAIASTSLALLADLTTEKNRTKAMMLVGISIGASFVLALVLGPLATAVNGLQGLFLASSALALLAILVVLVWTPNVSSTVEKSAGVALTGLKTVFSNNDLLRFALGVFVLHLVMTANFIAVPLLLLEKFELQTAEHWKVYLPVFFVALLLMGPFVRMANDNAKRVMLLAVITLGCAQLLLSQFFSQFNILLVAFVLFFAAFNLLEALLPTLVSKAAKPSQRGAAMGVFSSAQFFGAFAGGALGGYVFQHLGANGIFLMCFALTAIWLRFVLAMKTVLALGSVTD